MRRDAIYTALTAQMQQLINRPPYNVLVASRGFVPWEQADSQPAVYVVPSKEIAMPYKKGFPLIWMLQLDIYVYVKWVDSVEQGGRQLSIVMDGVEEILMPGGPNGGINPCAGLVNTLGGLVNYCALQGPCEVSEGFLNQNQCIARMPVEIQVPQ